MTKLPYKPGCTTDPKFMEQFVAAIPPPCDHSVSRGRGQRICSSCGAPIEPTKTGLLAAARAVETFNRTITNTRVYLRDVGSETDPCWVPCAKGDPGAVAFVPEEST